MLPINEGFDSHNKSILDSNLIEDAKLNTVIFLDEGTCFFRFSKTSRQTLRKENDFIIPIKKIYGDSLSKIT